MLRGVDADIVVLPAAHNLLELWAVTASPAHPFASAAAVYYEIDASLRWAFDEGSMGQLLLAPFVP